MALIAEKYMTREALVKAGNLLDSTAIDTIARSADDFRRDHPETGPRHYIDIPLADSNIDLARECPKGDCLVVKTDEFLAVLRDPKADRASRVMALKFVVHFVGDMHQPLHDEDDGDKGGNTRQVIFEPARQSSLGLGHRPAGTYQPKSRGSCGGPREPHHGTGPSRVDHEQHRGLVLEGHRLAQTVAYGDLGTENPCLITPAYERQADQVIELQLERAGVRLAYLLKTL